MGKRRRSSDKWKKRWRWGWRWRRWKVAPRGYEPMTATMTSQRGWGAWKLNVYCITGHSIKGTPHSATSGPRTEDSKPFRSPYCCTSGAQFLIVSSRLFLHALFDWHSALLPRLLLLLRYFLILVEVSEISWGIGRQHVKNGTKNGKKIKVNTRKKM